MCKYFSFFEGRAVNANIKTVMNSHTLAFHMQSYWWMWFPDIAILTKFSAKELEPNNKNVHTFSRYTVLCKGIGLCRIGKSDD